MNPLRALVVDDSKAIRSILGNYLEEAGFEVAYAGDGREALDQLSRGLELDLMLVDWNMPVMNGLELLRAVRANVLLSRVKIMMVTTETALASISQALDAGANEYVMKPFNRDVLKEKLALLGLE